MNLGIYANWDVRRGNDGFYIESIHAKYIDAFFKKAEKIILLSSVSSNKDIPDNYVYISFNKVELISLPYISSYARAVLKIKYIWHGIGILLQKSDVIYLRTPEPFGWFAALRKNNQILNYHFTSNPLELIKRRFRENFSTNLLKYILFYPEFLCICLAAKFNKCSANGPSVINNVPFFLKKKLRVLIESSLTHDQEDVFVRKSKSVGDLKPLKKIKLICVSRLQSGKGLNDLILAFSKLSSINELKYEVLLSIVGSGPIEYELKNLAVENQLQDKVFFLGYIKNGSELDDIYSEHHIFINPSLSETGPRTLLEALHHNLCVISSDVGYARMVMTDYEGKLHGYLVVPGSQDDLFAAMRHVILNIEECIANAGSGAFLSSRYSLNRFVSELFSVNDYNT